MSNTLLESPTLIQSPSTSNPAGTYLPAVPLSEVRIPFDKYQRIETNQSVIKKLEREWDDRQCDPIKLYRVGDHYECFDGGHRILAAQGIGRTELSAIVYDLSDEEAADIFSKQTRNRRTLTRFDLHKSARFNREEKAIAIDSLIGREGFEFTASRSRQSLDKITAVGDVYKTYDKYGEEELSSTLSLIKEYWPTDTRRTDGGFISGLNEFLHFYGERMDEASSERLAGYPVSKLLNAAQGYQQKTRTRKVAQALRDLAKLRKLPKAPF